MNFKKTLLIAFATIFMMSCVKTEKETKVLKYVEEPHSYAQPNEAVITHLDLDIDVNFDTKIISGTACYDIETNEASEIILLSVLFKAASLLIIIDRNLASSKRGEFSLDSSDAEKLISKSQFFKGSLPRSVIACCMDFIDVDNSNSAEFK